MVETVTKMSECGCRKGPYETNLRGDDRCVPVKRITLKMVK
jgi:hypothetical protein